MNDCCPDPTFVFSSEMKTQIKPIRILIASFLFSVTLAQFGKISVTLNDKLLRGNERQEITSLAVEIQRFFQLSVWDDDWKNLNIPLNIQLIFEGAVSKGSQNTFLIQALFFTNTDQRFFDSSVQFYYNSGGTIFYDPVQFDPLGGFLAFYAHLILAGEMDTYEPLRGTPHIEKARTIALRGVGSDYSNGWASRTKMINDITSNSAFREGKFSYYYGMELFKLGETEQALEEFQTMMKNFELVYERFPRARTQYFIKAHVEELTTTLTTLQQYPILIRLSEMDSGSASVLLRNMVKETKN